MIQSLPEAERERCFCNWLVSNGPNRLRITSFSVAAFPIDGWNADALIGRPTPIDFEPHTFLVEKEGGFAVSFLGPADLDGDAVPLAWLDEDGAVGDADAATEFALEFTETEEHGQIPRGKSITSFATCMIRLIVPLADDPPAALWCIGHGTLWRYETRGVAHGVAMYMRQIDADFGTDLTTLRFF